MNWSIKFEESDTEGILSANYTANTKKEARDKFERTFPFPDFVIFSIEENTVKNDMDHQVWNLFDAASWMF